MTYHRPDSFAEALAIKASDDVRVLAGGTDFYPALRGAEVSFPVLDITAIAALRHIRREREHWSIGANTTWTDIQNAKLPAAFDALKLAARDVGSIQIQNRGTVAGNLCNASPAADSVPAFLILDAMAEMVSRKGERRVALRDFITGNRKTLLAQNEIVSRILIPHGATSGTSAFTKLGARKYLVISIAMVAARIEVKRNRITSAAMAVGACSEVALRLGGAENQIMGCTRSDVARMNFDMSVLSPIDDVRAPAEYRRHAAETLVRNTILQAMDLL